MQKHLPFSALLIVLFISLSASAQKNTALAQLKQYAANHQQQLSLSQKDIESLFVTYQYTDASTGIQHIYAAQKLNGLTIAGTSFSLHTAGAQQTNASRLLLLAKYKIAPVAVAVTSHAAIETLMTAIGYT